MSWRREEDTDIYIWLGARAFMFEDSEALGERLRAETDLRIESDVVPPLTIGPSFDPDFVISLLTTIAPLVRDMYVNLLSSALWDAMHNAFSRHGREDSEATFRIVKRDEEGRTLRVVVGQTGDPEIIKDLIRQALEDD